MSIPTISPLSPAPNRQTSSRTQFAIDVDRRLSEENRLTVEANALAEWMNERAADVGQGASSVAADKHAAAASAASAATARTQAQAAAASASDSAAAANTSRTQAQTAATSAAADAQRAEDAADRAEAIAGPVGTAASKDVVTSNNDTTGSRIPNTNWAGLNGSVAITNDAKNILFGNWLIQGATDLPITGDSTLFVCGHRNRPLQFICPNGTNDVYFRSYSGWNPGLPGGNFYNWARLWTSSNQFALGATRETARTALGITDSPGRVQPENNLGAIAAATQTINIDVTTNESTSMSLPAENAGALTLNFTNIPTTTNGACVWYVDIAQAGRRQINFTLPAGNTLRWAGGAVPVLSNASGWRSQIMFEKKLGLATVYASVVREGLFN